MTEREIFFEALQIGTPEARAAYLEGACAGDVALRGKVEELLKEHFSNDSLMAGPAVERGRSEVESQPAPAPTIGRYKLLEKIGEGGFGEVWMAEQCEPVKRRIALKIIKPGMDSRQIVARFEAERQALAMMDHANIARIFDAGTTDTGRPYFVMELVRGIKITEYCDQKQLPTRERLKLFILVCQAIQHAHQKGIIHRDVKPSNILVTLHDGVPVPKVIDFGIAKATQQELTDKTVFTQFQQFIGTPAYISPEQAEMSGLDIDTRADIYSLGVLLYELLVGQTPFDAKEMLQGGLDALRQIIRQKEPVRPSTRLNTLQADARTTAGKHRQTEVAKLVHQLQGDLDWIVMKCLEKDRQRRYETANGLAMDIQRHLANEPVVARPPSAAYKLQKAWQRHKLVVTAGIAVFVALALGLTLAAFGWIQALAERRRTELAREETRRRAAHAEGAEREARQQLYIALHGEARATVRSGELGHRVRALEALRSAAAISNHVELRQEVFAALALPDLRFERELALGPHFRFARCDPAFTRVALGSLTGPVEIRALADNELIASLPPSTNLPSYVAIWSPDGRYLAVKRDRPPGGYRSDWEIWETSTARQKLLVKNVRGESISFAPQANEILVAQGKAIIREDLDTGRELGRIPISREPRRLEISINGEQFATVYDEAGSQVVTLSDLANGEEKASWSFSDFVGDLRWHPSGKWLAVADHSGKVHLLDCQTGELKLLGRHKVEAVTLAVSPNGDYLVSGGWEREMICWNLRTFSPAFTLGISSYHLQFSADGRRCATLVRSQKTTGALEEFKLHAFERPVAVREFAEDLGNRLDQAVFSPEGRWLAASGRDRVGLWDLSGQSPGALIDSTTMARLSFSPDGKELFGSGLEGDWRRWRITADPGERATTPQLGPLTTPPTNGFNSVCLVSNLVVWTSSAGSRIAPADDPGADGSWIPTSAGLNGASPDGRWLAIFQRFTPYLHIHRLPGLELVAVLTNRANILTFSFSPQGDEIVVAGRASLEFWNTTTWQRTRELTDYRGIIYQPDARALWLTRDLRTAGLIDARTLELLLPLPTGMLPLAISPDGHWLAVSVDSRKLQVWDVPEVRRQLAGLGLDWRD